MPEKEPTEEELEKRFHALLGDVSEKPEPDEAESEELEEAFKFDPEVERDLHQLEKKAGAMKRQYEARRVEAERKKKENIESSQGLGVGLQIAYLLLGFPMAGLAIGWFIDYFSGTEIWKGFCMLGTSVFGVIIALTILNKSNKNS